MTPRTPLSGEIRDDRDVRTTNEGRRPLIRGPGENNRDQYVMSASGTTGTIGTTMRARACGDDFGKGCGGPLFMRSVETSSLSSLSSLINRIALILRDYIPSRPSSCRP